MYLQSVEIQGYRSIQTPLKLFFDRRVTVLIGANDHGKTNVLQAVKHLNGKTPFDEEHDLNWDAARSPDTLPSIVFTLELSSDDRTILDELLTAQFTSDEADTDDTTKGRKAPIVSIPTTITMYRKGVGKVLAATPIPGIPHDVLMDFLNRYRPDVEVIEPSPNIPDSITASDLTSDENLFMKGILYYAGLPRDKWETLFEQTDTNLMLLSEASNTLNATLRQSWSQGRELEFRLQHDSSNASIDLRIKDPNVFGRYVRASYRSSGFTHFFALKTILHARQQETDAQSYIWLFDEPGIYLHPDAQHDLLQVIETISQESQIIYTTHSIFMINKNFPTRHRLLIKTNGSTTLDGKPYNGRWHSVLEALGLSMSGTVLFANNVLLVEGDSDSIFIYALLQKLLELGFLNIDLNDFSALAMGDDKGDVLIRVLMETSRHPNVAILVDGDQGGKAKLDTLKRVIDLYGIKTNRWKIGRVIEDYLPLVEELYVEAVVRYVVKISSVNEEELRERINTVLQPTQEGGKTKIDGLAAIVRKEAKEVAQLSSEPSKVGIAREYVFLLGECTNERLSKGKMRRALELADLIKGLLPLGGLTVTEGGILQAE